MIQFLNIRSDGEYICADAEDKDHKRVFKIKVHKEKEEYYTDPEDYTSGVIKALWPMRREFKKRNGNIKDFSVAWG